MNNGVLCWIERETKTHVVVMECIDLTHPNSPCTSLNGASWAVQKKWMTHEEFKDYYGPQGLPKERPESVEE